VLVVLDHLQQQSVLYSVSSKDEFHLSAKVVFQEDFGAWFGGLHFGSALCSPCNWTYLD
jgi:hypothetical protein